MNQSEPNPVEVGKRLRALRLSLGMEGKDFAEVIDVDPSSYSKIENGKKPLRSGMAFRAAERFGVSMDFIYRGDLSRMPADQRAAILSHLGGHTR